jgi:hypothetical protein
LPSHARFADGYDVLAVSEVTRRSEDRELIEQGHGESRILLAEGKDFGWPVYVSHADSAGIILIRFPGNARRMLAETIRRLIREQGARLTNAFLVVQPGQFRISRGADISDGV